MKAIALLIGLGLFTLIATTGCEEEEHEHHHGGYGGAYDGYYQGYGHGAYGYPDYNGQWRHD